MRLINADELKKEFSHDEDWDFPVNTNGYVVETINRMPTVDAIPIKDLKKMKKLVDKHWYRYCTTSWDFCELIDEIIELWRKENESNISN